MKHNGYIAIFLVIIVVATVTTMVTLNFLRATTKRNETDTDITLARLAIQAEACRDMTLLDLKTGASYTDRSLNLPEAMCTIHIESNGTERTITMEVTRDAETRVFSQRIDLAMSGTAINITPISWQEQ